jgi:hypothetical protein
MESVCTVEQAEWVGTNQTLTTGIVYLSNIQYCVIHVLLTVSRAPGWLLMNCYEFN